MSEQIPDEGGIEVFEPADGGAVSPSDGPGAVDVPDEGSQAGGGQPATPGGEIPTKPTPPERKPLPPVAADAVARAFQQRFERPNRPVPDIVTTPKGRVDFYQVEAAGNVVKAWIEEVEVEGKEPEYVVVNGPAYVEDPAGEHTDQDGTTWRYDPVAALAEAIAADREANP